MIFELTREEKKTLLQAIAKGILNTDEIPRISGTLIESPYKDKSDEELSREINELMRKLN